MKALKFNNTEVSLNFTTYRNNGTLAVQMNTVPDKDLYGVVTVNLGCPLASQQNHQRGSAFPDVGAADWWRAVVSTL